MTFPDDSKSRAGIRKSLTSHEFPPKLLSHSTGQSQLIGHFLPGKRPLLPIVRTTEITEQNFESLLAWLDPDRERAGRRYESIRERLVRIFSARGCRTADELADETIDRVSRKAADLTAGYSGDPAAFFYGVAKKVFLEYTRRPPAEQLPSDVRARENDRDEDDEDRHECLDKCLDKTVPEQKSLIVAYYEGSGQARITKRKQLQSDLGLTSEALRVKALRIRLSLQQCVTKCLRSRGFETFPA